MSQFFRRLTSNETRGNRADAAIVDRVAKLDFYINWSYESVAQKYEVFGVPSDWAIIPHPGITSTSGTHYTFENIPEPAIAHVAFNLQGPRYTPFVKPDGSFLRNNESIPFTIERTYTNEFNRVIVIIKPDIRLESSYDIQLEGDALDCLSIVMNVISGKHYFPPTSYDIISDGTIVSGTATVNRFIVEFTETDYGEYTLTTDINVELRWPKLGIANGSILFNSWSSRDNSVRFSAPGGRYITRCNY